jgi:ATP-dependent DNA ligase
MADFPPLKGEAKGGKTKLWLVQVKETKEGYGQITVKYGYEGGALQEDETLVEEGKNLGKKNETTPLEQAVLLARSAWNKKKAGGYVELGAPEGGAGGKAAASAAAVATKSLAASRATEIDEEVPLPMLAHKWPEKAKYVKFPCFVQPKFDGTRTLGLCGLPESKPCLFSRQRKAYPHLDHIKAILQQLPTGLILDGELYRHDMEFQSIVGTVKKRTLTKSNEAKQALIQFHCYDFIDIELPFEERFKILRDLFKEFRKLVKGVLVLCPTEVVTKKEDLKVKHDEYVADGYEGLMIRNTTGLYDLGNRSTDLLKMKEFQDDEFEIVGFYEGKGEEEGCVLWRLKTKSGKEFGCRPKGTHEERKELFKEGKEQIGKMLTVRFQELTLDGIPRFPIGIAIRDYE